MHAKLFYSGTKYIVRFFSYYSSSTAEFELESRAIHCLLSKGYVLTTSRGDELWFVKN